MEFNEEAFVKEIKRVAKLRVEEQVRSLLVSRGGISWEPPCYECLGATHYTGLQTDRRGRTAVLEEEATERG